MSPPPAPPHPEGVGSGEILVSAGGGDVGADIFAAALDAARANPQRHWRLLVGGGDAADRARSLIATAPANALVEPARPDFRQMLHHADMSISMAGYNTALDLLQTGTPAVLIPFDAGGEVEQTLRAEALGRLPGMLLLQSAKLSGHALRAQIDKLDGAPRRTPRTEGAPQQRPQDCPVGQRRARPLQRGNQPTVSRRVINPDANPVVANIKAKGIPSLHRLKR